MEKNRLDKFYKDKLDDRQFELKDAYWENMENLIEKDDKRRGAWKYVGLSLLLLLFIVASWFVISTISSGGAPANVSENITANRNQNESLNTKNKKNNKEIGIQDSASNSTLNNQIENSKINNAEDLRTQNSVFDIQHSESENRNQNVNEKSKVDEEDKLKEDARLTTGNSTFSSKNEYENQSEIGNTKLGEAQRSDHQQSKRTIEDSTFNVENENTDLNEEENSDNQNSIFLPPADRQNARPDEQRTIETVTIAEAPDMLPNKLDLLSYENTPVDDSLLQTKLSKPKLKKPWHFGITAQGFLFPAAKEKQNMVGTTFGLVAAYNFNPVWSLNADLLYTLGTGQFESTQTSEQIAYSFGRSVVSYQLTPSRLHFVELPLYVKLQLGRVGLEGGLGLSYLTGLEGQLSSTEGGVEKGWMDKEGFNRLHTDLILGYHFRMNKKLEIGLRAQYTLGEIIQSGFTGGEGQDLKGLSPYHFRLNLRYFLK